MASYRIEDYLSQQLLDTGVLGWIDSKEYTTSEMSKMWYDQLMNGLDVEGRHYSPEQMAELFSTPKEDKVSGHLDKMFTPATFDYLNNPDKMAVQRARGVNTGIRSTAASCTASPRRREYIYIKVSRS